MFSGNLLFIERVVGGRGWGRSLDDTILVPDTNPTSLRGFSPQQFSLLSKLQVSLFAGYFIKEYMYQKLEKDHLRADIVVE
jgi:hypothetical protein